MPGTPDSPGEDFIRVYASLARAPEIAMNLASKMAHSSVETGDFDTGLRWARNYDELHDRLGADDEHTGTDQPEAPEASEDSEDSELSADSAVQSEEPSSRSAAE